MGLFTKKKKDIQNNPFEVAIYEFISNPTQETYNNYLNEFAAAMNREDIIHVPIFAEDNLPDGTPAVSFARIFVGDDKYLYFFTSEKYVATSKHPDFAQLPLMAFVNMVKDFDDIKGIFINPSDGKDVWVPMELLKNIQQSVLEHRAQK